MAHPNEARLASLYEAFGRGDLEAVLALCSSDVEFRIPGNSRLTGSYSRARFEELVGRIVELSEGTFSTLPYAMVANDTRALALLTHSSKRGGRARSVRTVHLWDIRDGAFSALDEWPGDALQLDEFWGR